MITFQKHLLRFSLALLCPVTAATAVDANGNGVDDDIEAILRYDTNPSADVFILNPDGEGNLSFSTDFENNTASGANLDGQLSDPGNGSSPQWEARARFDIWKSGGNTVVQLRDNDAPGSVIYGGAIFDSNNAKNAWFEIDYATIPRPLPLPEDIPSPASSVISVNELGQLCAFDGTTQTWQVDTTTVLDVDTDDSGYNDFVSLRIFLDYNNKLYSVYVNDVLKFSQLGFLTPSLTHFQAFGINAENETHLVEFDNVKVSFPETPSELMTVDYIEWAEGVFSDVLAAEAKPEANTDGDSLDQWLEFVLAGNPYSDDNDKLPAYSVGTSPTTFDFSVTRRTNLDYNFRPQLNDDLAGGTWREGATYITTVSSVDNGNGTTTDNFQAVSSEFDDSQLFLRWAAE